MNYPHHNWNVLVHTPPGPTPPFLSINLDTRDNSITVSVRSTEEHGAATAQITINAFEFVELTRKMLEEIRTKLCLRQ